MFEQDRITTSYNDEFLMNSKGVEYLTGNATLDTSTLTDGQVIEAGTAIHKNEETGHFELVTAETVAPLRLPALVRHSIRVDTNKHNYVSAITAGNPIEELCTGVTDVFKEANGKFIFY